MQLKNILEERVKQLYFKKDKLKFEYQILIGWYWHKYSKNPSVENNVFLEAISKEYEEKFKQDIYNLSALQTYDTKRKSPKHTEELSSMPEF